MHMAFIEMCVVRYIPIICQSLSTFPGRGGSGGPIDRRCQVPLFVHKTPLSAWHMKIKEMLDAGRVGEVYQPGHLAAGDGRALGLPRWQP